MALIGNGWLCVYDYKDDIHDLSHALYFDGYGEFAPPPLNATTFAQYQQQCNSWGGIDAIRIVDAAVLSTGGGNNTSPFDPSTLDPVAIAQAFAAGATVVFPAFAIAWGAAFVINTIRGRRG